MAFETTTTTVNDIVQSTVIEHIYLDFARDHLIATPMFRRWSLQGREGNVLQLPRFTSDMTVNDNGASTDGEFDATEGTALGNTQLDTESVTLTVGEYGIQFMVTDNIAEDSIMGSDFMTQALMYSAQVLATAVETDAVGLFASLSNGVGTSTQNITIAMAVAMADGIRTRGGHAPDGIVYVLDDVTWADIRDIFISIGTSWTAYPAAAATLLDVKRDPSGGLRDGRVGEWMGAPIFSSGLTATANAAADVVSAAFIPSSPANDGHATYGYVEKRPFNMESIRVPGSRGTQVTCTRRCGVGEIADAFGTKAVTDA
jgi:hypothetical protein